MTQFTFLCFTTNSENKYILELLRDSFIKIVSELKDRLRMGETITFASFSEEMGLKFGISTSEIDEMLWHYVSCEILRVGPNFELNIKGLLKVPEITEKTVFSIGGFAHRLAA